MAKLLPTSESVPTGSLASPTLGAQQGDEKNPVEGQCISGSRENCDSPHNVLSEASAADYDQDPCSLSGKDSREFGETTASELCYLMDATSVSSDDFRSDTSEITDISVAEDGKDNYSDNFNMGNSNFQSQKSAMEEEGVPRQQFLQHKTAMGLSRLSQQGYLADAEGSRLAELSPFICIDSPAQKHLIQLIANHPVFRPTDCQQRRHPGSRVPPEEPSSDLGDLAHAMNVARIRRPRRRKARDSITPDLVLTRSTPLWLDQGERIDSVNRHVTESVLRLLAERMKDGYPEGFLNAPSFFPTRAGGQSTTSRRVSCFGEHTEMRCLDSRYPPLDAKTDFPQDWEFHGTVSPVTRDGETPDVEYRPSCDQLSELFAKSRAEDKMRRSHIIYPSRTQMHHESAKPLEKNARRTMELEGTIRPTQTFTASTRTPSCLTNKFLLYKRHRTKQVQSAKMETRNPQSATRHGDNFVGKMGEGNVPTARQEKEVTKNVSAKNESRSWWNRLKDCLLPTKHLSKNF